MSIKARVVNTFKEKEHDDHIYKAGEPYPAEGFEASEERVAFLSTIHPQYKKIYLADVIKEDDSEQNEFPKHVGGGTYELSNSEKVKGKEEAQAAEDALKDAR